MTRSRVPAGSIHFTHSKTKDTTFVVSFVLAMGYKKDIFTVLSVASKFQIFVQNLKVKKLTFKLGNFCISATFTVNVY